MYCTGERGYAIVPKATKPPVLDSLRHGDESSYVLPTSAIGSR